MSIKYSHQELTPTKSGGPYKLLQTSAKTNGVYPYDNCRSPIPTTSCKVLRTLPGVVVSY